MVLLFLNTLCSEDECADALCIEMQHVSQPAAEIVPEIMDNPNKEFLVNVYTLARQLDPHGTPAETGEIQASRETPYWPLPLWITIKDSPKTICDKFRKQYGYSLGTLMLEPDSWEDDGNKHEHIEKHEPRILKLTGCQSCLRGEHKNDWVLRNQDWTVEVRMRERTLS